MIVAGVLLGTVSSVTVPALTWIAAQRREAELRLAALEEATNLMDGITARPPEDLTDEWAQEADLSAEVRAQLSDPRLSVSIDRAEDDPEARRVRIELSWKSRAGQRLAPVRLTAWVYPCGAGGPAATGEREEAAKAGVAVDDVVSRPRGHQSALGEEAGE